MSDLEKPILRVLRGEAVWPPPMWLMRQAGRYLPEYRAVRAQAPDFIALCTNPALASEVTLQPIRRYGFDAAILFSDILILPWALGHGLIFKEGEGPVLPRLRDSKGVSALNPAQLSNAVAPIMETIRRVRIGLASDGFNDTALIGFAGAPFTVACYMVEGGGSRDFAATRTLAYADPALFGRLIDTLTVATIEYLALQIQAGAEVVMLFDSWAGVLSPSLFRRYVIGPTGRIVSVLRERFPSLPIIGFPRLAGLMIGEYVGTGVDAIGLDTATEPGRAARLVPNTIALQGNLDPMALVVGGSEMKAEVNQLLITMKGRPFVFNLGHGIVPQTPPEHVGLLRERVRAA